MKKLLLLFHLFFLGFTQINGQETYWQISARGGLDFPTYQQDFKFIDYKTIGFQGGISLNKYWNNWGIQVNGDFIKNNLDGDISNLYYPTQTVLATPFTKYETDKKDITRLFFGAGPSYTFKTYNEKFSFDVALMGGLGIVDGGEILVKAIDENASYSTVVNYHSGFDKVNIFTGKAEIRTNYFINDNFGLQIGAYYMHHFGGVEESQKNDILKNNGYPSGTYFVQANSAQINDQEILNGTYTSRSFDNTGLNENEKMGLHSFGVFFGFVYKFGNSGPGIGSSKSYGYNSLDVAVVDEYSGQAFPKTKVFLKDKKGKIIKSGYTNDKGIATFSNLKANDYTVTAKYATFTFEDLPVSKSEFRNNVVKKKLFYTDRNFIISGTTTKCNSSVALPGVSIFLENENGSYKQSVLTDNYGNFSIKLPENDTYKLYGKKLKFFSDVQEIVAKNYDRSKTLFVNLEICATETKCGESIVLNNINYDLDKFFIREDAKPELDKVVRFLKDNPNVNIILKSHTDSRASNEYNMTLSQNRAQAAVNYITSKGINMKRITAKGYGETQLLNKCSDGVQCTEAEHQLNRRTEFEVVCPK